MKDWVVVDEKFGFVRNKREREQRSAVAAEPSVPAAPVPGLPAAVISI